LSIWLIAVSSAVLLFRSRTRHAPNPARCAPPERVITMSPDDPLGTLAIHIAVPIKSLICSTTFDAETPPTVTLEDDTPPVEAQWAATMIRRVASAAPNDTPEKV